MAVKKTDGLFCTTCRKDTTYTLEKININKIIKDKEYNFSISRNTFRTFKYLKCHFISGNLHDLCKFAVYHSQLIVTYFCCFQRASSFSIWLILVYIFSKKALLPFSSNYFISILLLHASFGNQCSKLLTEIFILFRFILRVVHLLTNINHFLK